MLLFGETSVVQFASWFTIAISFIASCLSNLIDIGQTVLSPNGHRQEHLSDHATGRVEIWDAPFPLGPIVPAALGSPLQPFRLLLDLTWSPLIVPSAELDTSDVDPGFIMRYFANRSSTFAPGQQRGDLLYAAARFEGDEAFDTFQIAGIETHRQPFLNVDHARSIGWVDLWTHYDGVFGLSPKWNSSDRHADNLLPSPWHSMVEQSRLKRNIFAIEMPKGPRTRFRSSRTGEISFGAVSPAYESSDFETLPAMTHDDRTWAVQADFLLWDNGTSPIFERFPASTVAIFTTEWFIGLPGSLAKQITRSVDHYCDFLSCWVDCADRARMPNLTVGLAGQNFTLTPYEYSSEVVHDGAKACTFDILSTKNTYGFYGPIPPTAVALGTMFLSAFYRYNDLFYYLQVTVG
ncbi:Vacuolar protein [Paramyrothecium foliicola]|nr:Vacuolar protein [Paramyrothecium foliicola]